MDGTEQTNGDQANCAHPHNKNLVNGAYAPAEWWVDLQDTYRVDNVIVFNTYDNYGESRNVKKVQCIYGRKWVNPPQIATEFISSPFVPDMSST